MKVKELIDILNSLDVSEEAEVVIEQTYHVPGDYNVNFYEVDEVLDGEGCVSICVS